MSDLKERLRACSPLTVALAHEALAEIERLEIYSQCLLGLTKQYEGILSPKYPYGTLVEKHSGAWWAGRVVGWYSTGQTPIGVCVQLVRPEGNGPVQIYPVSALRPLGEGGPK